LHHAGVEPALVGAEVAPRRDPGRDRRQLGARSYHAELLLPRKRALAERLPPRVVAPAKAGDPLLGCLMRRMDCPRREIEEERLAGRGLLLILDEADRLRGEVVRQVIAVLGSRRRVDETVVAHQLGGPLVGVAVQESVVALEAQAEGPAIERAGGA